MSGTDCVSYTTLHATFAIFVVIPSPLLFLVILLKIKGVLHYAVYCFCYFVTAFWSLSEYLTIR